MMDKVMHQDWHVDFCNPEIVRDDNGRKIATCVTSEVAEFMERAVDLYLCVDAKCPRKGPHPATWTLPAVASLAFCCDEAKECGSVTEDDLRGAYEVRGAERIRNLFS